MKNGEKMPTFGLGSLYIADAEYITKCIVELGYRHIDTAAVYFNEEVVGKAVKAAIKKGIPREELFITTKVWDYGFEDPVGSLKESLKKLDLEYVDLFLVHTPVPKFDTDGKSFVKTPMYKTWGMMEECVDAGLTKSIGVSNFHAQMIIDMLTYARIPPVVNQIEVHPYYQQTKLSNFCRDYGIEIVAYSPFSAPYLNEKGERKLVIDDPVIQEISESKGVTASQVALAWNIESKNLQIPKTSDFKRAKENIEALEIKLTEEEMEKLKSIDCGLKAWNHDSLPIFE